MAADGEDFRPQHDAHMMRRTVVGELDIHIVSCELCPIEFNRQQSPCNSLRVLDNYFIAR